MKEWAASRLAPLVGCSFVAFVVLLLFLSGRSIQLPAVIGGGVIPLRWVTYIPLVPAIAVTQSMEPRKRPQELASARRLALYDGGLLIAIETSMFAALAVANCVLSPIPAVAFTNCLSIPLLTVLFAVRLSAAAAAGLMTACLVTSQSYAPTAPHASWVRVFQPEGNQAISVLVAVAAALLVCVAMVRPRLTPA